MSEYIVSSYVQMRKQQKEEEADEKFHSYVSARTLLGVLRLSQALARLRMDDTVGQGDVDEALRLMECSKASLYEHQATRGQGEDHTTTSKIFRIIKDMASAPRQARRARGGRPSSADEFDTDEGEEEDLDELSMIDVRARVLAKGFTETQLMEAILEVRVVGSAPSFRLFPQAGIDRRSLDSLIHSTSPWVSCCERLTRVPLRLSMSSANKRGSLRFAEGLPVSPVVVVWLFGSSV
jgi:hypothetical protein